MNSPYLFENLLEVAQNLNNTTFDGVNFRLETNEINTDNFETKWGFSGTLLRFPCERENIQQYNQDNDPFFLEENLDCRIDIYSGDTLFITSIKKLFRESEYALLDPHDIFEYFVYLGVKRVNGNTENLNEALIFTAKDAMGPHSFYYQETDDSDYYDYIEPLQINLSKLKFRAERYSKNCSYDAKKWLELGEDHLSQLELMKKLEKFDKWDVEEVVELAITAGYAIGKAETTKFVKPLADLGVKKTADQLKASQAGAKKRRKPETGLILNDAKKICASDSNISLTKCSIVLAEKFSKDPSNVRKLIKQLFEVRPTLSGKKEYRPRKQGSTKD